VPIEEARSLLLFSVAFVKPEESSVRCGRWRERGSTATTQGTLEAMSSSSEVKILAEMATQMSLMNAEGARAGKSRVAGPHPLQRKLVMNLGDASEQQEGSKLVALASPSLHRITEGDEGGDVDESWQQQQQRLQQQQDERVLDQRVTEAQLRDSTRKFQAKSNETEELSYVVRNLKSKLQEVEEECMRYSIALQGEVKEKRKLELRNSDLSSKLSDARQGLRDTQAALSHVQQATEVLIMKRDQRDQQLQRVLAENKVYEARVYELENALRNSENSLKSLTANRDDLIDKLQQQIGDGQDSLFKAQSEAVRLRGEKELIDAELDSTRRKLATVEVRSKQAESNLHTTYAAEIDRLEGRLRVFAEKVEEGRAQEARANELQAEVRSKMAELKSLEARLLSADNQRKEQEIRQQAIEAQLRSSEIQLRQLDLRHRNLEQEFARANTELAGLKRNKGQAEEDMRDVALQNAQMQSEKHDLRHALAAAEERLLLAAEQGEQVKRQKRELERVNNQLDEAGRRIIDLERQQRLLSDDWNNTEARVKNASQRMAALMSKDAENRQLLNIANARITELYNLARDLHSHCLSEEMRGDKLERDFTGVVTRRPHAPHGVPYSSAPVLPLPAPADPSAAASFASSSGSVGLGLTGTSLASTPSASSSYYQGHAAGDTPTPSGGALSSLRPAPPSTPKGSASLLPSSSSLRGVGSPAQTIPATPTTRASSAATDADAPSSAGSDGAEQGLVGLGLGLGLGGEESTGGWVAQ